MITILLLVLIYFAFISLGLPDGLLGVAWPAIMTEWRLSLDTAGLVSIVAVGGTIISSFLSGYMIKKIGTGKIVFISCLMTGAGLLGISLIPSFYWILVLAIPLGLGAGTVDSALNNYVATHYKAHHMNWLHSFWGVGATLGPVIMGQVLASGLSWRNGYRIVGTIQLSLALLLLISLPLWGKNEKKNNIKNEVETNDEDVKIFDKEAFGIKGVKFALLTFALYCSVELSVGLWGSSYLVQAKNMTVDTAAFYVAVYYGSITMGRFLSGFFSFKISNNNLIKYGSIIALTGAAIMVLPISSKLMIIPLLLIGLGLSPIFPAMIHETPVRFGKKKSQTIIGYQMALLYR